MKRRVGRGPTLLFLSVFDVLGGMYMSVISLLLILALLGLVAWALVTYIPMQAGIQKLIIVAAIVIGALYLLNAFGIGLPRMNVPQVQ